MSLSAAACRGTDPLRGRRELAPPFAAPYPSAMGNDPGSGPRARPAPAWLPRGPAEAAVLVLCAAGLRVLLELWLPAAGPAVPTFDEPADRARALLGETLGWSALALAFALAARPVLALPPGAALGAGALALLALSAGAVLGRSAPGLSFGETVAAQAAAASVAALVLGAVLTGRAAPSLVFSVAVGALAACWPVFMQGHAFPPDAAGAAAEGARRAFPPHLPPLFALAGLWLLLGGAEVRGLWRAVGRDAPWPFFGFVALAVGGGWMAAARAESLSSGVPLSALLPPPAAHGVLAAILSLALAGAAAAAVRGRLRQRASTVRRGVVAAMAAFAAVLAAGVSLDVLIAAAAFGAVLLAAIWPSGPGRPSLTLELAFGGALAAAAFCAGALALPESGVARLRDMAPLLCAAAAAGASIAGLARVVDEAAGGRPATTGRPRLAAALWCLDFGAALAVAAVLTEIGTPLLWTAAGLGALGFAAHLALDRGFARAATFLALVLAWSASGALLGVALLLGR